MLMSVDVYASKRKLYKVYIFLCSSNLSVNQNITNRVKLGKFGHQVNSDTHLQIVEIQMRWLLMSRLIDQDFHCLLNLFFIPIIEL